MLKRLPILILFKGAGGDADWIIPVIVELSKKYDVYSYFKSQQAYQSIKSNTEIFNFWKKINKGFFIDSIYYNFFWKLLRKIFFLFFVNKKIIYFFNKKIHEIFFLKKKLLGKNLNNDFKFVFSEYNFPNSWLDSILENKDKTLIVHYPHTPNITFLKKKFKSNYKLVGDLLLISGKGDLNRWKNFIDIAKIYSLGIPRYDKSWIKKIINLKKKKIVNEKNFVVTIPYKSFFDLYPEKKERLENQFNWILQTLLSFSNIVIIFKIHPRINSKHFFILLKKFNKFKKRIIVTNSHLYNLANNSNLFICNTNTATIFDSIFFKVPTIQFAEAFKNMDGNENFNNFYKKNNISLIFKNQDELQKILIDLMNKRNMKKWILQRKKFRKFYNTSNSIKKIVYFLEKKYNQKFDDKKYLLNN